MATKAQRDCIFQKLGYVPSVEQAAVHDDESRIRLVAGGERALALNTPVPTPIGWKTIASLQEGDEVFDDKGSPCKITHKTAIFYDRQCYKITFDTGETLTADAGHLWATQSEHERKNTNRRKKDSIEFWIKPAPTISERKYSIRTTAELTLETNLLKPKTKWGTGKMANYSITCCLPVEYPQKALPISPYLLGVWLGDGTSSSGNITSADIEIITRLRELGYQVNKTNAPYGWRVDGLSKQLRKLGLTNNKSIPQEYLQASTQQRIELVKGLMDTDGGGEPKSNEFYNKNERLIDSFRELLASLGLKNWKRDKEAKLYGKPCGIAYTVSFSSTIPVFALPRKLVRQNLAASGHTRNHYIRTVEPTTSVPVQCLTVNSKSNLFLIGKSFIPTHNSGKSFSSAMDYMGQFWEVPLLWLVAADYARTGAEYNYICESFSKLGIEYHATKQVDPGEINVMGGFHIVTKSSSDPRKIAMEAPTMVIACEASQLDYETFLRLRGRIAEKRGRLLMSGTFESSLGWYPSMFNQLQSPGLEGRSFSLPTWSNLAIYPGGREDPEIKLLEQQCSKEWFLERYAGIPTPPKGQVFTEFSTLIHTGTGKEFEFNPAEHVYLAVDPGYASAYSVLAIQKRGEYLYVVDEVYERGLITSDIIKVCKQRPWWNKVIGGAIDIAAQAHQAMPAPTEIWVKESGVVLQCQKLQIRDGIEAVKRFLLVNPVTNRPLLYVNTKCKGLISEMGGCENPITNLTAIYQWKQDREGNVIGEIPDDKNNHSVKALAYLIVNLFGYSPSQIKRKIRFF